MINRHKVFIFYIISFLEGGAVMSSELIVAKLLAPFFGSTLYVWSSILLTTLGGLATGYYLGGYSSGKLNPHKIIIYALGASTLLLAITPFSTYLFSSFFINSSVETGSLLTCLFINFPLMVCFGIISPVIIHAITEDPKKSGTNSGIIYSVSTFGGIISTFSIGFYFIPNFGLKFSAYYTSILLFSATLLSLIIIQSTPRIKHSAITSSSGI
jgi:MFS family permease